MKKTTKQQRYMLHTNEARLSFMPLPLEEKLSGDDASATSPESASGDCQTPVREQNAGWSNMAQKDEMIDLTADIDREKEVIRRWSLLMPRTRLQNMDAALRIALSKSIKARIEKLVNKHHEQKSH